MILYARRKNKKKDQIKQESENVDFFKIRLSTLHSFPCFKKSHDHMSVPVNQKICSEIQIHDQILVLVTFRNALNLILLWIRNHTCIQLSKSNVAHKAQSPRYPVRLSHEAEVWNHILISKMLDPISNPRQK